MLSTISDPYYDVRLKHYRWEKLKQLGHIECYDMDITDVPVLEGLFAKYAFDAVVNMAAMAGVRYSIENPHKYFKVNTSVCRAARSHAKIRCKANHPSEHVFALCRVANALP